MSEWIDVEKSVPETGSYLVSFLIEVLSNSEKPFEDVRLYAEGHFDRQIGWSIENRYVMKYQYAQPYQSPKMRVTHWQVLDKPCE